MNLELAKPGALSLLVNTGPVPGQTVIVLLRRAITLAAGNVRQTDRALRNVITDAKNEWAVG